MIKSFLKYNNTTSINSPAAEANTTHRQFNHIKENNANILQNARFQFAQKHALSIYNSNTIYSFIPKNGCTTLRTSLAAANGFFPYNNPEEHINWVHNNSYTFSANLRDLVTAQYTFTVLRCPYSRLASLFLDKFLDKTPVAWTFYRSCNNSLDLDTLTFQDFILKLKNQPNLINADIHWRKQSDFLIYQKYDDYFDLDHFNTIKKTLANKINLNLIDTRNITQHGRENYTKVSGDFSNASAMELKKLKDKGELPSIDSLFTPKLKDHVKSLYKDDFLIRESVL